MLSSISSSPVRSEIFQSVLFSVLSANHQRYHELCTYWTLHLFLFNYIIHVDGVTYLAAITDSCRDTDRLPRYISTSIQAHPAGYRTTRYARDAHALLDLLPRGLLFVRETFHRNARCSCQIKLSIVQDED